MYPTNEHTSELNTGVGQAPGYGGVLAKEREPIEMGGQINIMSALQEQFERIRALGETCLSLEETLKPILISLPETSREKKPDPTESPALTTILKNNNIIADLTRALAGLRGRIQL
jgi:hypothetical protein